MILPFLLLGSLLLVNAVTDRVPGGWGDLLLFFWLGSLAAMNLGRSIPLIISQHAVPLSASNERFYEKYRDGKYLPVIHLAELIQTRIRPEQKIISPSAPIVAYLSDRQVMMERDLLPLRRSPRHYPDALARANIRFAVFPGSVYRDKNPELARLINHGVIYPKKKIARVDGMTLAQARVQVPAGDWRELPTSPAARASLARKSHPTTRSAAARKKAREAAARRARHKSAPATHPASTTHSASKKKKKRHAAPAATVPVGSAGQTSWIFPSIHLACQSHPGPLRIPGHAVSRCFLWVPWMGCKMEDFCNPGVFAHAVTPRLSIDS
jgi:hypothetical protein